MVPRHKASLKPGRYKNMSQKHAHLLAAAVGVVTLGAVLGLAPDRVEATRSGAIQSVPIEIPLPEPELQPGAVTPTNEPSHGTTAAAKPSESVLDDAWETVIVQRGDNLSHIFKRMSISPTDLHDMVALGGATRQLVDLRPGETIKISKLDGRLQGLQYDINESQTLRVNRGAAGLETTLIHHVLDKQIRQAAGVIDSSLYLAAQKAGLSDSVTMQLASIFGWDVDFVLDIREGDSFVVLYEELYRYGEKVRDGAIVAAEFTNAGHTFQAVRYTDADGNTAYFTPTGNSLRKAFLRSPVDFARVSSRFNLARKHPILNRIRAHKGVDYAAPTGTPVKATGDGKIVQRGNHGGYGRTVTIQHGQQYTTLYAHLSSYAKGLGVGSRVRQGQVVGYVGQSGLATGPHLHYEFQVNGVHRNPLTVPLPDAEPIAAQYKADFLARTQPLLAQLTLVKRTAIALND